MLDLTKHAQLVTMMTIILIITMIRAGLVLLGQKKGYAADRLGFFETAQYNL